MNPEIIAIIGTSITVVGLVYSFIRNFRTDMDARFDKLINEMKDSNFKMDQRVTETNKRMDGVYHILLKRTENNE